MRASFRNILASLFLAAIVISPRLDAKAASPAVVATLQPLHALASMVMEGIAVPDLLIPPGGSPHGFTLKPSDAKSLARADVVFFVGGGLEGGVERALARLGEKARLISLLETPGLIKRRSNSSAPHDDHHHGHDHGGEGATDLHIWLDPVNAQTMVRRMADVMSEVDPDHAVRYQANAKAALLGLQQLEAALHQRLRPVQGKSYVVFHDAYGYFEDRFGLAGAGWVAATPEQRPGAKSLKALRAKLAKDNVRCLFTEPQFPSRQATVLARETEVTLGVLDPLGAAVTPGKTAYAALLHSLADAFVDCLTTD